MFAMNLQDGSLQDAIASWIAGHEDEIGSTQLQISSISGSCLLLQANSKNIHMSVPSSSEEVFLVTAADPNPDPSFDAALLTLNEKFERLTPELDGLFVALEYLLKALKQLQSNTLSQPSGPAHGSDYTSAADDDDDDDGGGGSGDDGDGDGDGGGDGDGDGDDDDDDYVDDYLGAHEVNLASTGDVSRPSQAFMELCSKGFVYAMAVEAKHLCEGARRQFPNPSATSSMNSGLAWCIVKPNPSALSIDIKMETGGILHDAVAAASLGLSLDFPMRISLEINKDIWCRAHPSSALKIVACHVEAVFYHNKDLSGERVSGKSKMHVNEGWFKDKRHNFGEEVFMPELVHCFFNYLEQKNQSIAKSSDVLKELQQFTTMGNPIVGLIHFLVARMRALPNWCIACWDTLPYKVGRLRTCDKDLCLYKFEDLGLGPTILQELQKSRELMDFEISLAIAAASSNRDVFEPFPAFLLKKQEIRDRSGWFSKESKPNANQQSTSDGQVSQSDNKSLFVLNSILNAYPSIEAMQCFNNELDLKKVLAELWLKSLSYARTNRVNEGWSQKSWLPYDVLRFLISSNRLTMCCLKGSEEFLQIHGAIYQFAVLHDNPEKEAQFENRRAEKGGSFFAFHGSPAGNWFSILRNGLRSLSNTHYMSTGAGYGAGIYVATQMATSLRYALPGIGWDHGHLNRQSFSVLAICEIVNGSVDSRKLSHDIMVVRPECEQDILIRYILVLPGGGATFDTTMIPTSDMAMIHEQTLLKSSGGCQTNLRDHHSHCKEIYFTKQQSELQELKKARWLSLSAMCRMEEEEERRQQTLSHATVLETKSSRSSCGMPGCMQAIQKELKSILSQINAAKKTKLQKDVNMSILALLHIDVPDEANLQRWLVYLSQDLFQDTPLHQDLVRRATQDGQPSTSVKLECVFPDTFPMAPPFIRVVSPRFRFHTGHITVGGSLCMELLTESGWSPAFCFESVLVQIVSAMMEGGARLDFSYLKKDSEYGVDEARAAFVNVARFHGWIKG